MKTKRLEQSHSVQLPAVRVSPAQERALRSAAHAAGTDLSTWMRRHLFRAAGLPVADAARTSGRPPGRESAQS